MKLMLAGHRLLRAPIAVARYLRMPARWRLSLVLAVAFGALVLGATVTVSAVLWLVARNVTIEFLNESVQASIEELERGIRDRLDPGPRIIDDLADLIRDGRLDPSDATAVEAALGAVLAGRRDLSAVLLVSPDLDELVAIRSPQGLVDFTSHDLEGDATWEARLAAMRAQDGSFWGPVTFVEAARQPVINVQRAVRRGDTVLAYLGLGITVAQLSSMVDDLASEGMETPFILLGEDRVLAHPELADLGGREWPVAQLPGLDQVNEPVIAAWRSGVVMDQFQRIAKYGIQVRWVQAADGQIGIMATKPLSGYGTQPWLIGTWVPGEVLTATVRPLRQGALVVLALLAAAVLLALFLGRRMAAPINAMTEGATQISSLALDRVKPLPRSRIRELDEQGTAFNTMLTTLQAFEAYVPRSLVARLIRAGRADAIRSRERDLTVMFTDIAAFTTLAERLPAPEIARLLNEHFALVADCIEREEGTVDKFLGDGLMAFWGAPDRVKQRARRACRAALAIEAAIRRDNEQRRARGVPPVRLRIGIHRGPLVVGNIGSPGRINYTVVGDTANVAARLEQLPKTLGLDDDVVTLVSDTVVEECAGEFAFERMGEIPVYNRREPVEAYRLAGPRDAGTARTIPVSAEPQAPVPAA